MAGFSTVTLTGNYGAGTAGSLLFQLQQPIMNNAVTTPTVPIVVALDTSGSFSQTFTATGDASTVPSGIWYNVTESITGAPIADYAIAIPGIQTDTEASISDTDLSLIQLKGISATTDMIGGSVTGANIPTGTIVTSVVVPVPINEIENYPFQAETNTVTLSQPATAAGTNLTVTFGESVDISYLRPSQLGWA